MEYYFDELSPHDFQRLINAILVARFGEDVRLTPLRGADGGRDGETAPGNPYFEYQACEAPSWPVTGFPSPRPGRYLFQAKHHLAKGGRVSDARDAVVADFARELKDNVLGREGDERVNYFFLITSVSASKSALDRVDRVRKQLLGAVKTLHADVWWYEQVAAFLDQIPQVWHSFPGLFAGRTVPLMGEVAHPQSGGLPRAVRVAIAQQYERDRNVKFRQIELEQALSRLFIDLDLDIGDMEAEQQRMLRDAGLLRRVMPAPYVLGHRVYLDSRIRSRFWRRRYVSALSLLLNEDSETSIGKLVLEGGPGQGKSTISQMVAQIHRHLVLGKRDMDPEGRWALPLKARLPFRIELRRFGDWLSEKPEQSIEQYLAHTIGLASGGECIDVHVIHNMVETSPLLLIFDGLDEIGIDDLRDRVIDKIADCTSRFESGLGADIRVILTTRPPAMTGRRERLANYFRVSIAPLGSDRVEEYTTRWLSAQVQDVEESERIRDALHSRLQDPHVVALAQNPMQLSVLLQLIKAKGEAFPDRRAELYTAYFQIVIDRDVEKRPQLRETRQVITALHQFLGYRIHALTESNQASRTLTRHQLLDMVGRWLGSRGHKPAMARQLFELGRERLGLIVAAKGEAEETRYGFEIQPVEEYFAAAFINDEGTSGSAHEVFEEMVRRPYWREVALFLAGLQRPNEKADIVARARHLDEDDVHGWRQDGRATTLQLLEEGVFSYPPYLNSEALDFVLDLVDPRKVRVQVEPPRLVERLKSLLKVGTTKRHSAHLNELLEKYSKCKDQYILRRLYEVAGASLSSEDLTTAVMSYQGSPSALALVRLYIPHQWDVDLRAITSDPCFWSGVPDSLWANAWWSAGLRTSKAADLCAPSRLHQFLVREFAVDPLSSGGPWPNERTLATDSKWAIWRLTSYQQVLSAYSVATGPQDTLSTVCEEESGPSFQGLDRITRDVLEKIIYLLRKLLIAIHTDSVGKVKTLREYAEAITHYIRQPGLVSWVACRCAIRLAGALLGEHRYHDAYVAEHDEHDLDPEGQILTHLAAELFPMYVDTRSIDAVQINTASRATRFLRESRVLRRGLAGEVPKCVRLDAGEKPIPTVEILAEAIRNDAGLPLPWLNQVFFTSGIVRPLAESLMEQMPELLQAIAKLRVLYTARHRRLRVQQTRRILKIVRGTNKTDILAGALVALSSAKFLRLASTDLVLKLLRAGLHEESFAVNLFRVYDGGSSSANRAEIREEASLMAEVAGAVMESPEDYSFRIVCAAAGLLAEREQVDLPPLLSEEGRLGILAETIGYS